MSIPEPAAPGHGRDPDPALPARVVAARQAAAQRRAALAAARAARLERDRQAWEAIREQATIPLEVRSNARSGDCPASQNNGPLNQVVPTADAWSGRPRRPRRHPAGRALHETALRETEDRWRLRHKLVMFLVFADSWLLVGFAWSPPMT